MELQLSETLEFALNDSIQVELPSYMKKLDPSNVCQNSNKNELIIAAGTDPRDQKMTLVTGDGRILVFDSPAYYIPPGSSVPVDGGKQIFFENVNGRWPGDSLGFYADSSWIIQKSASALTGATIQTNYQNDNDFR